MICAPSDSDLKPFAYVAMTLFVVEPIDQLWTEDKRLLRVSGIHATVPVACLTNSTEDGEAEAAMHILLLHALHHSYLNSEVAALN
jgi:hypothetical protein